MQSPDSQPQYLILLLERLRESYLGRNLVIIACWLGVWQIGRLVEYTEHASVWFPAAGMTFAAFLVMGVTALPGIMLSAIVITFWAGYYYDLQLDSLELLVAGTLFGAAHCLPYYLGAKGLRWLQMTPYNSIPLIMVCFLLTSALMSLFTTLLVLEVLIQTNMLQASAFNETWLPFWIGDMAGVVVVGPMFAALFSQMVTNPRFNLKALVGDRPHEASPEFKYKVMLNLILLTSCMFLAKLAGTSESAFAIFFLAVTHMWIACTESAFYNTISLALSSFLIALWVHVFGLMEYVMVYQFAINVVAANALFGIAVPTLAADNHQLRKMVYTDSLTNTSSRDHMRKRAELEIMRSIKEFKPLSMVVFDIDHFKRINDALGHMQGDEVLKKVSQIARESLRPTDILGRYGGDEFVALLIGSDAETARAVSERVLIGVQQLDIGDHKISCSFGVAETLQGDDFDSLFDRADQALYKAKNAGRGMVAAYSEDEQTTQAV